MLTSRCVFVRPLLGTLSIIAAAGMLAACGGSQSQLNPQGPAQMNSAVATHALAVEPDACLTNGGVRVAPCRIRFSAANPGPDTVYVRSPHGAKGMLREADHCGGASGIATITQGSGDAWIVTAGPTTGRCKARFNYFNNSQKVGWATLRINNTL
jgi:hypothetical protein